MSTLNIFTSADVFIPRDYITVPRILKKNIVLAVVDTLNWGKITTIDLFFYVDEAPLDSSISSMSDWLSIKLNFKYG